MTTERKEYCVAYLAEGTGMVCGLSESTVVREHAYADLQRYQADELSAGGNPDLLFIASRPLPRWERDAPEGIGP